MGLFTRSKNREELPWKPLNQERMIADIIEHRNLRHS